MKKLIHRVMAFSLSFLLVINTAAAGRWFQSCLCSPVDVCPRMACGPVDCGPIACGPSYSCSMDCGVSYYGGWEAATVYQPACGGCNDCGSAPLENAKSNDCDCNQSVVAEGVVEGPVYSEPTYSQPTYQDPTPVAPALPTPVASEVAPVAPVDAFSDMPEVIDEPADLFEELPAEEPAAFNEPSVEELSADEPSDDLFDEVMPEDEVAVGDEVAFGDEPMDAFGDEGFASEEEVPAADDDLFGDEPAEELMEEPADDLFGEEVAEEPMDDFGSDDFGGEEFSDEAGVEDTPAFEEPAFEEEAFEEEAPADDFSADDAGDLFGDEPAEDTGDLFGDEADDFGGADDFAPADEPPADGPAEEDAFDFDEAPAEGPSDEEAFDDLFGAFGAILQEPGGYFATSTRTWVDNTGTFSCVGRLVAVEGSNIRLRKTNGTMTMVPLGRLSSRDLEFVNRQASAQYEVELIRTAQR